MITTVSSRYPIPSEVLTATATRRTIRWALRPGIEARARRYADIISGEVEDAGTVGFLVWGDPAFYDSTIRILESIVRLGIDLEVTVIPGISSIQLLAARHKIILNRVGAADPRNHRAPAPVGILPCTGRRGRRARWRSRLRRC